MMKKLFTSFKNNWLAYLGVTLVVMLILSAIFNLLIPDQQTIPPTKLSTINYDQTQPQFNNLTYGGNSIEPPVEFSIAQTQATNYAERLKEELTQIFGLKQVNTSNVWTSSNFALTILESQSRFILDNQESYSRITGRVSLEKATQVAQNFLAKYLPQYQLQVLPNQAEYFQGQYGDPGQASSNNAQIIKVAFGYQIDGYPVYFQQQAAALAEVTVSADEVVRKVSFTTQGMSLKIIGQKPSISLETALNNINQQNLGSIIATGYERPIELNMDHITGGELDQVQIEYRIDTESQLVYPFYHFSGLLQDAEGESFVAELITPAVEIETSTK